MDLDATIRAVVMTVLEEHGLIGDRSHGQAAPPVARTIAGDMLPVVASLTPASEVAVATFTGTVSMPEFTQAGDYLARWAAVLKGGVNRNRADTILQPSPGWSCLGDLLRRTNTDFIRFPAAIAVMAQDGKRASGRPRWQFYFPDGPDSTPYVRYVR